MRAQVVGEAMHGSDEVGGREGPEVEEVRGPDGKDVGFFVGGVDGDDGCAGDGCVLEGGGISEWGQSLEEAGMGWAEEEMNKPERQDVPNRLQLR